MKSYPFLPSVVLLFSFYLLSGQTYISPDTGVSWTLDDLAVYSGGVVEISGNAYLLNGEVVISGNDTLILEGAVEVLCAASGKLTIEGVLTASGDEPKVFDVQEGTAHFAGFSFNGSPKTSVLNGLHITHCQDISLINSDVRFVNSYFLQNGFAGEPGFLTAFQSFLSIENCFFQENEGAAVMTAANSQSPVYILNSVFVHNNTGNTFNVPQLNFGATGVADTVKVINCTIEGEATISGGIGLSTLAGGNLNAVIYGNNISLNRYGIAVYGNDIHAGISSNTIVENNIQNLPMEGGSGIMVYGNGSTQVDILGNTIEGNLWGVTLLNAPGVFLGDSITHGNNIIRNNGNEGQTYNLYNNTANDYYALYNYWGANTQGEIEDGIFHYADDNSLGQVYFIPFLEEPPVQVREETAQTDKQQALFYPSPAKDFLRFSNEGSKQVGIFSLDGHLVYFHSAVKRSVYLPDLKSGVYLVKIQSGNNDVTWQKLVIK